ncbi:MAG: acyl-CoA dehydrogenase family protein, partial [Nocardioidaceae bacterium]
MTWWIPTRCARSPEAEGADELPVVASIAKAYCSEAYSHAAGENIQIHGGIGFT